MHEVEPTDDEATAPTFSPVPIRVKAEDDEPEEFGFFRAMQHVKSGKKITKIEWNSEDTYGFLHDGTVKLHKPDGKLYSWIISDGDLAGTDYTVVKEK